MVNLQLIRYYEKLNRIQNELRDVLALHSFLKVPDGELEDSLISLEEEITNHLFAFEIQIVPKKLKENQ